MLQERGDGIFGTITRTATALARCFLSCNHTRVYSQRDLRMFYITPDAFFTDLMLNNEGDTFDNAVTQYIATDKINESNAGWKQSMVSRKNVIQFYLLKTKT